MIPFFIVLIVGLQSLIMRELKQMPVTLLKPFRLDQPTTIAIITNSQIEAMRGTEPARIGIIYPTPDREHHRDNGGFCVARAYTDQETGDFAGVECLEMNAERVEMPVPQQWRVWL